VRNENVIVKPVSVPVEGIGGMVSAIVADKIRFSAHPLRVLQPGNVSREGQPLIRDQSVLPALLLEIGWGVPRRYAPLDVCAGVVSKDVAGFAPGTASSSLAPG